MESENMTGSKIVEWDVKDFELLSFETTDAFVAVFAEIAQDGITDLFAEPIDALGLAKVTTRHFEGIPARMYSRETGEPDTENELIGLQLQDGCWYIVNDASNFSGIAKRGANINSATGRLNRQIYKTLRHESPNAKNPVQ